jgi:hypothetical protein
MPSGQVTHIRFRDVWFGDRYVSEVENPQDNEDKKSENILTYMVWG